MSQSEDVLKKMEALLKKHQGGNLSSDAFEEPADLSAHSAQISHDNPAIPTLTDVAVNAPPRQRARDAIPVVNDRVSQPPAADAALELDLDPYFIAPSGEIIAPEKETLPSFDAENISAAPAPSEIEVDADTFIPPPAVPVEPPLPDFEHAPTIESDATPTAAPVVEPPRYAAPPKPPANNYATLSSTAKDSSEQITDSFTEQVLRHLDKHLKKALETSITPQLAKSLDKALSSMLDQFSLHIEHMVRETIARELNKQLESLRTNRAGNASKQPDDPV